MQCRPNNFLGPIGQMDDCGETNLCAVSSEDDMLVDNKAVNSQFHLLVDLDEFTWDFDDSLDSPPDIGMSHVPLELEDRAAPDHLCSLHIIQSHV